MNYSPYRRPPYHVLPKRGNPDWRKSDFQDVFYHKPPGKYNGLFWFIGVMLFLLLCSLV